MDNRDWVGIQNMLEEGKYSCKDVVAHYKITQNQLSWASRKGLVNKTTWNLQRPKHTEETKQKLSLIKSAYYAANPEKHPWKQKGKFVSIPCEALKAALDAVGIVYLSEYTPLEDRFFSIDIAFPDIKLGIEVNGNQHYTEAGLLTPYYLDRHNLIVAASWTLIELHYSAVYNKMIVEKIISSLLTKERNLHIDYSVYLRTKKTKIMPVVLENRQDARDKDAVAIKYLIEGANIDFTKHGWVGEVSKLTGIKHQKVGKWMQQYMPDVYTTCFKRK